MTSRNAEKLHFTEMDSIRTTDLRQYQLSWTQIVGRLLNPKVRSDREGVYLFGGQHFKPHSAAIKKNDRYSRCNDNVLGVDLLIIDVDNAGCTREAMSLSLEDALVLFQPFEYVCFTSFNHRNPEKDNGVDKFRFVFPLASYCPKAEWSKRIKAFRSLFGFADPASFTLSQPFYPAIIHPQRVGNFFSCHNAGDWFDWNTVEVAQKAVYHSSPPTVTGKVLDRQISIRTVELGTLSSSALFDFLHVEGNKVACYSPFREEKNPSAFVARKNNGLYVFDMGNQQGQFIPVVEIAKDEAKLILKKKVVNAIATANVDDDHERDEEREVITAADIQPEQKFDDLLTLKERQRELRKFAKIILQKGSNKGKGILFAPEGYGKSYLVIELLKQGKKVVFGCQTNEQAQKKADEFKEWLDSPEIKPHFEKKPSIHWIWSKDYNFQQKMGFPVQRNDKVDPFDVPDVSRRRTIQTIVDHLRDTAQNQKGVDLEAIAITYFDENYKDVEPPSFEFDQHDVIVSTFTQIQILAISQRYRAMSDQWVIIFDDPGVADVTRLKAHDESVVAARRKTDTQRVAKGIEPLPVLQRVDIDGSIYFVRPDDTTLGIGFDFFFPKLAGDGIGIGRKPSVIFTTTEFQTRYLIERSHPSIYTCDLMTDIDSGRITMLGTNYVRSKHDGLIPVLVKYAMSFVDDGRDVVLIADGLGQALNHINNKGQNGLKECHVVVELSVPHPGRTTLLQHELEWASGRKEKWSPLEAQGILMYDQLNQAIGRNAGYRYVGAETIILVDANRHGKLCAASRYKLSPYSIVVGQDSNPDRQKKKIKPLVEYHDKISPMCKAIIDGLLDPYAFLASEGFRTALRMLENEKQVKKLIQCVENFGEDAKKLTQLKVKSPKSIFLQNLDEIRRECGAQLGRVNCRK